MMLTPAEIDSLRHEAKESQVQIKAYLKQLREEKAHREIASSGSSEKDNRSGRPTTPAINSRSGKDTREAGSPVTSPEATGTGNN